MTNRTIIELLQIVLDNISKCSYGFCEFIDTLFITGFITNGEAYLLHTYLYNNRPENKNLQEYWWLPSILEPRIEWLKEHIKLNS